jgi:hypothetical protein
LEIEAAGQVDTSLVRTLELVRCGRGAVRSATAVYWGDPLVLTEPGVTIKRAGPVAQLEGKGREVLLQDKRVIGIGISVISNHG